MSTQTPAWQTGEPPKDGMTIVAIGRIIWREESATIVDSFVGSIFWGKGAYDFEDWRHSKSGYSVKRSLDEEVFIDWWSYAPCANPVTPEAGQ